jgi:hypothetical protein
MEQEYLVATNLPVFVLSDWLLRPEPFRFRGAVAFGISITVTSFFIHPVYALR